MTDQRPFLILGDALRCFLEEQRGKSKAKIEFDQIYCFTCKQGQKPLGMMVDCVAQTAKTARMVGLCEACGGTCNRMVSRANLASFAANFDVAYRGNWNT